MQLLVTEATWVLAASSSLVGTSTSWTNLKPHGPTVPLSHLFKKILESQAPLAEPARGPCLAHSLPPPLYPNPVCAKTDVHLE